MERGGMNEPELKKLIMAAQRLDNTLLKLQSIGKLNGYKFERKFEGIHWRCTNAYVDMRCLIEDIKKKQQ